MATYTFRCLKCGEVQDVVAPMSEAGSCAPSCCGGVMAREYRVPQVVPDSYPNPVLKSMFHALEGSKNKNPPPFSSRSEERRFREKHHEKFGWGKEI